MIGLFCLKNKLGGKTGTKKSNKLHNALTHHSPYIQTPEIKYKQTRRKERKWKKKGKNKTWIMDEKCAFCPAPKLNYKSVSLPNLSVRTQASSEWRRPAS